MLYHPTAPISAGRANSLIETGGDTLAIGAVPAGSLLGRPAVGDTLIGYGPGTVPGNTLSNVSGEFQSTVQAWACAQTTSVEGITLENTTPATASIQQWGPLFVLGSRGWKSNATAESQSARWALQCRSTPGTGAPGSNLYFLRSLNEGAWTNSGLPYFKSDGLSYIPNLICTTSVMGVTVQSNGDPTGTAGRFKLSNATPAVPGASAGSTPNIPDAASGTDVWVKVLTSDGNTTWLRGVQ